MAPGRGDASRDTTVARCDGSRLRRRYRRTPPGDPGEPGLEQSDQHDPRLERLEGAPRQWARLSPIQSVRAYLSARVAARASQACAPPTTELRAPATRARGAIRCPSRQTGPGFQFENPDLTAERATTLKVGLRLHRPLHIEVWGFHTLLDGAVIKRPMEITDCPPNTLRCNASWTRFMLVNAAATSAYPSVEYTPVVDGASERRLLGDGPPLRASDA